MFAVQRFSRLWPRCTCLCRINTSFSKNLKAVFASDEAKKDDTKDITLGVMGEKYKEFSEENSEIILDIYEERLKYSNLLEEEEQEDRFAGLNLERGSNGVYEIEDLVDVLHRENAEDVFVATVPKEAKYVDYICVVSGKSKRHMKAIAQFVRRVYKMKRHKRDILPKLEGENSDDWIALDLGNIALHIFSKNARTVYDLDSLWALGAKFDDECNKKEPISDMLEKHAIYLADLEPAG